MHPTKFLLSLMLLTPWLWANEPSLAQDSGDALWAELGQKNILTWSPEEMRLGYRNIRHINPVNEIPAAQTPSPLPVDPWSVGHDWSETMEGLHLAGLLVIEDGRIRHEAYRHGHGADQRWMSFSITKSVVALLYGVALQEGFIESLDETVADHLPQFMASAYANVSLRQLLQMASGVQWSEDYQDPTSDVSRLDSADEQAILTHLASLPQAHPEGSVFNYNTGETILAGVILAKAVGMSLSEYLSTRLWSPLGMEHGADWALMGEGGSEMGGCCISATLRDYGRLGLAVLDNLSADQPTGPVPQGFMHEASQPSPSAPFYGYFWWLEDDGDIRASGIFGQAIYVSPAANLVVVMHGLWPKAVDQELAQKRAEFIASIKALASGAP